MFNINCQGKIFRINDSIVQKIPIIKKMLDNKESYGYTKETNEIFFQMDPKYFQLLINFVTIPNFCILDKYKSNFINVSTVCLDKLPWITHHKLYNLKDEIKSVELTNIYNVNSIFVTMIPIIKKMDIPILRQPYITSTQISVNNKKVFNKESTLNIGIWQKENDVIDSTCYDIKGNVAMMGLPNGFFSLHNKYVAMLNRTLLLNSDNKFTMIFDNSAVEIIVEINYDTINL